MPNITVHAYDFTLSQCHAWEQYVRANDPCHGYALPAWFDIFSTAFGHKTYALAAHTKDPTGTQRVVGILPITHVRSPIFGAQLCSLPFVNYGGLLADTTEVAIALTAHAQELSKKLGVKSVELRHENACALALPSKTDHKVTMILDLPSNSEILWKGFKDKVRNQVRKAQKNGLHIVRGNGDLLDDFYAVFCVNMRDLGTPVYAKSFFAKVLKKFPQECELLCVYRQGQCVAAGMLYRYGNTMQMPWASSLLSHRNACPNHSLYWEALRISTEEGFAHFDFGRSTPNSGPWTFKKQWGVRQVPLCWEYILPQTQGAGQASLPTLSVNNPKYQLAIATWKKLPLWLANGLGPHIVRGIA